MIHVGWDSLFTVVSCWIVSVGMSVDFFCGFLCRIIPLYVMMFELCYAGWLRVAVI
jgi:hypothetical protein